MNVTIVNEINRNGEIERVTKEINGDKFGKFLSVEWYRLIQPYTPHRTGNLEHNVTFGNKKITYNSPYSAYVYNGENMNFRKDHNPKASARWDQRAIQEKQNEKLNKAAQEWINKNI